MVLELVRSVSIGFLPRSPFYTARGNTVGKVRVTEQHLCSLLRRVHKGRKSNGALPSWLLRCAPRVRDEAHFLMVALPCFFAHPAPRTRRRFSFDLRKLAIIRIDKLT